MRTSSIATSQRPATSTTAAPAPLNPADIPPAEWNLVIMACADNNLDESMRPAIKRIERVGSLSGKINVIALIDGKSDDAATGWTKRARLLFMQRDPSNQDRLVSNEIAVTPDSSLGRLLAEHDGELNTGDGATLKALLDYVREHFPAKHLATCIKNHGHAQVGIGLDEDTGNGSGARDFIRFADGEFTRALRGSKTDLFIGDGCIVSNEEVGVAAHDANVPLMVASEELMRPTSIDYERVLNGVAKAFSDLGTLTPERFADIIASFSPGLSANHDGCRTLSVTNLRVLPSLQQRFQAFSDSLLRAGGLNNNADLAFTYERLALRMGFDYIDLGDFARCVTQVFPDGELATTARAVIDALATMCRPRNDGTAFYKRATGLTVFAPNREIDNDYLAATAPWKDQRWSDFIQTRGKPVDPAFRRPAWAVARRPPRELWEERGGLEGEIPPPQQ